MVMLSEGRIDADNVFSLKDGGYSIIHIISMESNLLVSGVLTLYLDKETYERAGLVGKPFGVKGQRGLKPRWSKKQLQLQKLQLHNIHEVHGTLMIR